MKLHLPVKLRASLLAAVIAVPALLYGKAFAGTSYVAPSNEFGWDTNDITLNQRYNQTAGNTYTATQHSYDVYEMYGDGVNAKVRVGYTDETYATKLVYQGGQYGTVSDGVFTPYTGEVYFNKTGHKDDTASIIVKAEAPDQASGKHTSYMDGGGTFTSEEMVFENSLKSGSDTGSKYVDGASIVTDAIKVNNGYKEGSVVVLEDVNVETKSQDATMQTSLQSDTQLVILNGNDNGNAKLTDDEKDTLNIVNVENNNAYDNNTVRTVELGEVKGVSDDEASPNKKGGSLVIVGNKERTEATKNEQGAITQGAFVDAYVKDDHVDVQITSVDNLAELSAANANLTIEKDVNNVNTTTLVNSVTTVGGSLSSLGIKVNGESTLTAKGDIKNIIGQGATSTQIDGQVISEEGEISLTNGSVNEGAIVRAESASQGDVTLSNIESEKAAEISAGHDLTLKDNSKIDSTQKISIGRHLTVDDSSLTGYEDTLTVPGNMSVQNGGLVDTVKDLSVGGDLTITGSDVEGNHSTVTNVGNGEGAIGHVAGDVKVEDGGILSNSTLRDVDGNIIVDGATLTSSTINADGYLLATNGAILSKGDVVGEDGEISSRDNVLTVAQDSVITSGSQVSGTDLTVTSETGDPNLEISGQKDGHATTVTGDTNLTVDGAVKVDDGAELSLDGGEASDASLTANQLELRDIAADRASISNGTVGVESQTLIQSGNTFALSNTSGGLGTVKEVGDDSSTVDTSVAVPGTTLDISNGSGITAAEIITESTGQTPPVTILESKELFDKVVVRGDSTLNVEGLAAINEYVQGSAAKESAGEDVQGSKTTIDGDAWLADASITGTGAYDAEQGTETTLKSDAHIGSLTIAKEGALSFVGADNDNKTESYIARLTQTSDGHINVVNSVLTTPELHGENISLGLNGGTVVLDQVNAEDGATVPSVDLTNAHVLVGEITNASATGAPDQSPYTSTIRTTVDRVTSEYSFSKGDPATATVKTYVFIARKDGTVTVNGQEITVVAGQEVEIADTYLNEATEYSGEESVSTGVTTVDMAEFIADNQDLLDPKLVGVVDGDGNPVCDKDGHQLMAQVIEKGEDLTYYPDAQQSLGTLTEVSDGIASLTVKGDFDADNTLINAYLTGTADENDHVIADADSGLITIEGVLSGQDNTLNADVDVSIGGIVSKDGAAYEAANKVTALTGDIAIGEEGIVGSSNVLSATNGKITVTGAIEGNSNDLDAKLNIETGSITGDGNMLTSETGSITTGAITGDGNMLTSEEGAIATGAIDGDSNDLDAKLNIVTGSITGDSNMLTSTEGSITTGAIVGDSNILDANGDITVDGSIGDITVDGSITGDSNVLDSETGSITTGAIVGDSNDLDAVDSITVNGDIDGSANDLDATGDITVHGSIITGGINEETGNKLTSTEGSITVEDGISGYFNDLNAKLDIVTGPISGSSNTLTSLEDSITVNGDISGNSNVLDAKLDITTGPISGSSNTLTSSDASITVEGNISGDSNNLNAKLDIEAGDVSGDENVLIAGNEIHVEAVSGSDNDLTAGKDLVVDTDIIGDGNDLTSVDGGVYIDGQLTGNTNQVKGETIEIGSVTGTNQKVLSYGDGLSPDDVAIHIGEFNAQGSTVAIATGTDPVMGQASGNGAIVIDSMTSVGEGLNTGMQNTISSNISSVYIGSLNNYDAYTLIEAHDDIVVGSLVGTHGVRSEGDKAFNQTWKAENLIVNSAKGLTLVNSALTMTGSISGGDLTLELEQPADGTIYVTTSQASSVTLDSLTLVNGAQLKVLGKADIESLTLDGKYSALDATTTEINELTLANGASYNAGLVIVNTLNIDNSSMSVVTLAGVKEISLVDNAVLAITGVDGKTDLTGDLSVAENSKLLVTFDLKTEGSITSSNGSLIQAANITAGDGLVSDGGTIKTTSGDIIAESGAIAATQGGTIEAVGDITAEDGNITADNGTIYTTGKISAEKGNLIASNGSELTAGKGLTALGMDISASTVVGNVTLTGNGESFIKDASRVEGSITLSGGDITVSGTDSTDAEVTGSITGATNATLTNATVGNLTASGVVSLTNADTGWIKDAASVSMADASTVTGDITMAETNTGVTMDHSTLQGSIIGAIGATLENASLVTGDLKLSGGAAIVTNSTVEGSITGAASAELTGATTGNVWIDGKVSLTASQAGSIGGTDVTLEVGSSSGAITASGTVKVDGSTVDGGIAGAAEVGLSNGASVVGNVTMAEVNTGVTMDHATLQGSIIDAIGAKVENASLVTGNLDLAGGAATITASTVQGNVTGAETVTVSAGSTVGNISEVSGKVDIDDSTTGNIATSGDVELTNADSGTISGANVTVTGGSETGAITASGEAKVDASTVEGTISGTDVKLTGNSTSGSVTAENTVTVNGSEVQGTITAGGLVDLDNATAGDIEKSGSVDMDNSTVGNVTSQGLVDLNGSHAGTISGADVVLTNGSSSGAIAATGAAKVDASTVEGTIGGVTVEVTNGSTSGSITAVDSAKVENSTVDGTILAGGLVDLDNATVGNVTSTNGLVDLNGSHAGTISGADVVLTNGSSSGAITAVDSAKVENSTVEGTISAGGLVDLDHATVGNVTSTDGTVDLNGSHAGTISGADVVLTNGSSSGSITASGTAKVDGSTVEGTIGGTVVSVTGGSTTGAITSVDSAKVENSEVDGTITAGGLVDLDNATVGNVTSTNGTVDLNGSHAGTISGADVTLTNGSSSGAITATTGAASVTDSTVEGDISAEGVATVTGSTVEGTISGTDVTVTGGSTSGAITASGTAKVENSATGSIDAEAGVTVTGSTVEGTISGTDVSLTDSESGNIEANGDVILSNADTGAVSGATSLDMSNGAVVNGDVSMADGNTGVTMDGSTIHGSISNAGKLEITNQSMVTGNVELVGDAELSISDSTVAGTVTGAKSVELTNTSTGDVSVEDKVTLDNADTGSINANSLESFNGSTVTGNVTLTGGAADLTDTVVTGSISGASEATLIGSTVGGSVSAKGTVTLDNADTGSINANSLIGRNDSFVTGDVTLTGGSANLTDTVVTGSITGAGEVTLVNAQTGAIEGDSLGAKDSEITGSVTLNGGNAELSNTDVAGDITGAADVTMSAGLVGSIGASGNVSLTEVSSTGTVVAGGSVTLNASQTGSVTGKSLTATNASTVSGDVTLAGGDATVTDSAVTGAITGAGDVTLSNAQTGAIDGTSLSASAGSTVTGDVTLAGGDATVTDSIVTGSITGAGNVTVDQSTTGDITGATGDVALSDALVGTVQTAGDLSVDGTVKSDGSVSSDGLSVAEFGSLTAQGDVTADGLITIDGALTSTTGSVSLTGAEGSSISADVTAGKDVTLGGTIAAQDSTVTGENIVVNGTLNAAEGVALNGTVSGLGTINKTGGDDLVLAADTNMSGGAVNVSDGSTLKAEGGHMGSLAVTEGSTLVVGGDSEVATEVKADSLTMDASSTLQSTVNLAAGAADRVTVSGTTDLGGATLVLDGLKSSEEGAVADGTRFTVVQGSLQNSGLAEDVVHDLDKLNAHVENFGDHSDLVLSKNYKGADKTPNQTQVAGALASIDPEAVAGTQLGEVLDALAHTRSEADAKAALDSIGGAGLTAMQKMIADESHEHMQTFRSTFSSLSSGIDRRIDASGSIIPGVNSSAVTVTMTGGVTDVSGDQNIGDYRRSSCGFMLAGAHAVTENWTFGADFAYSAVTGKCTGIDVDADAYFVDLAMRYDNKRFHQMATLGAGFFGFDTKRFVSVKAQGHDFSGIADGSTTAASFNISYEASYDLIVSEDGHHVFSPVVMAEASFAQIKGMTEGGIGNAGLYSEADDVQSLTVGAGARYTFVYGEERNPGFISAEALAMGYAGDDSMTVRNAFIGGGPYFELKGPKAGNAGLRLNLNFLHPLSDKWSVTGNATAEFRSGQSGVGGAIGVKYSF